MTLHSATGGPDCAAPLPVAFHRLELGIILDLYSRRVAAGEWRDYAIDQMPGRAVFSIFRRAMEGPLFTITKWADETWEVCHGPRVLVQADSLAKALTIFQRDLRLV